MREGVIRRTWGWVTQATPTPTPGGTTVPTELFPAWVPRWLLQAVSSLLVLAAAYVISRLIIRVVGRRVAQRFRRPSLTRAVLRGIRVGVFVLAVLTVLGIYGLELGDIALSVTVFSAVVGVVLAPIVGSVISGLFLLADQPYEIGDMIELSDGPNGGTSGFVEDITLRYTKVFTLDNTFIVIPNGTMRERDVVNYSAEDPRTRLRLKLLVTYESDVPAARELIERAARQVPVVIEGGPDIRVGAARYPASPTCYIDDFADHGVLLTLRYWVTEPYKLLATRSKVQTNVWEALETADVEIAYPHSHLFFDDTSGELQVSTDGDGPIDPRGAAGEDGTVPGERPPEDGVAGRRENG